MDRWREPFSSFPRTAWIEPWEPCPEASRSRAFSLSCFFDLNKKAIAGGDPRGAVAVQWSTCYCSPASSAGWNGESSLSVSGEPAQRRRQSVSIDSLKPGRYSLATSRTAKGKSSLQDVGTARAVGTWTKMTSRRESSDGCEMAGRASASVEGGPCRSLWGWLVDLSIWFC